MSLSDSLTNLACNLRLGGHMGRVELAKGVLQQLLAVIAWGDAPEIRSLVEAAAVNMYFLIPEERLALARRARELTNEHNASESAQPPLDWREIAKMPELSQDYFDSLADSLEDLAAKLGASHDLPTVEIDGDASTVGFRGVTHREDFDAAQVIAIFREAYPVPKGLTTDDRPQPGRVIKKLPTEIQAVIETTAKGSVF